MPREVTPLVVMPVIVSCALFETLENMMMLAAAVLLCAAVAPVIAAEHPPAPRFTDPERRTKLLTALPEVEKVFERFAKQHNLPGLVYGVVIDGQLVAVKGFGVRDVSSKDPVTADTVFRIASMTKSFTAMSMLKLRDEGKLSLDDPVSKWIPEIGKLDFPTTDTAPIRVRQLLTHGMGLPEDNPWGDRQLAVPDATMTQWLRKGLPFSTPPDTEYEYANYGFALAGRVVAKAAGMPYRDYVEKKILAPLGMKSSTLEPSTLPEKLRAIGYGRGGEVIPPLPHGSFGPMGGMLVSANDLARYVAFFLSAWPARDGEETGPLRRSSLREMQRVWRTWMFQVNRSPDGRLRAVSGGYGYGLSVSRDCRFNHIVGHGGGLPGFGSYMSWLPEYGIGMFAMDNLTYVGTSQPIDEAWDVFAKTGALKKRELPPAPVLTATRDAIVKLWRHWDDEQMKSLAADNLFLDTPLDARRKAVEKMKAQVGECSQAGEVQPENWLRGKFRMTCERGFVDTVFTLAPTMPPTVQMLLFMPGGPPDEKVRAAAQGLASLVGGWSAERFSAIAAPSMNAEATEKQMAALRPGYGACKLGQTLGGNGKTQAWVRLVCERGPLDLRVAADGEGKVRSAFFMKPAGEACMQ